MGKSTLWPTPILRAHYAIFNLPRRRLAVKSFKKQNCKKTQCRLLPKTLLEIFDTTTAQVEEFKLYY